MLLFQLLSCVQLFCDPMDCCPPGSSAHGISQVRIVEQVAISFSRGSPNPRIRRASLALAGRFFTAESPGKPLVKKRSPENFAGTDCHHTKYLSSKPLWPLLTELTRQTIHKGGVCSFLWHWQVINSILK